MRDIEAHTDDYLALCPEAKELSDKYKPSDVLDEMMSLLHDRWSAYVGELQNRYSAHTHTHTHTYTHTHTHTHTHMFTLTSTYSLTFHTCIYTLYMYSQFLYSFVVYHTS